MQTNSSLNNLNAKATISPNDGPIHFLQKNIGALFLFCFQGIIETVASFSEKIKGPSNNNYYWANSLINRCFVFNKLRSFEWI
jgi:hypothetical protein